MITIMGQPEDYRIDNEETANTTPNYAFPKTKKLYRDTENGMIGGVLAGLGHYFGIDKVWLRILLLIKCNPLLTICILYDFLKFFLLRSMWNILIEIFYFI